MAYSGDISRWASIFSDSLIPRIIQLLLDSWKDFTTSQTKEVPITQEFFVVLQSNQESSQLPFLIDLEVIYLNEDGTEQKARLDLRFIHGYRREVYFSVECKRLRVQFPSRFDTLAREYVTEGMSRYFSGQYATDLDKGGMLGYVMDRKTDQAIDDVRKAIEQRRSDLSMAQNDTLSPSSALSSRQVRETLHNYGPDNQFLLYHVFLPVEELGS